MDVLSPTYTSVDKTTFRNGMARLASSVNVVTTIFQGERYGFTASAVCSVSDSPATLLVCINRSISCFPAFEAVRHFCVNTLSPDQEIISEVFGGRVQTEDRFSHGAWAAGATGVPVLANASVRFECELTSAVDQATHRILFGRVVDVQENTDTATLLYHMRSYLHV
jgi:flavin reductase